MSRILRMPPAPKPDALRQSADGAPNTTGAEPERERRRAVIQATDKRHEIVLRDLAKR